MTEETNNVSEDLTDEECVAFSSLNSEQIIQGCIAIVGAEEGTHPEDAVEFARSVLDYAGGQLSQRVSEGFDLDHLEPVFEHNEEGGLDLYVTYKGVVLVEGMTPKNYLVFVSQDEA